MPGDENVLLKRFLRWQELAEKFEKMMRFNKKTQDRMATLPSIWKVEGSERSGRADTEKWRTDLATSRARCKALVETGLRYDEALCCYVTSEGKVVLTAKDWFNMTAEEQQRYIKMWQDKNKKEESWRDRPPLL